jgi:AraC-like DNA-binding protein
MIVLIKRGTLRLSMVRELGVDHVESASPQGRHNMRWTQATFMLEGELTWRFENRRTIHLRGGQFCLTQPGDSFDVLYNALAPCRLLWIIIDPEQTGAGHRILSKDALKKIAGTLSSAGNPARKITPAMLFHLNELESMVSSVNGAPDNEVTMGRIRLGVTGVLLEAFSALSGPETREIRSGSDFGARVRELILRRPERNPDVAELSKTFRLSPGLFSKKFKRDCGVAPADFVRRVKLEEAARILQSGKKNITETAHLLGFSSSQYFASTFKKYFGKTPKQFKSSNG